MLTPRALGLVLSTAAPLDFLGTRADKPTYGDLGGTRDRRVRGAAVPRQAARTASTAATCSSAAACGRSPRRPTCTLRDTALWSSLPIDVLRRRRHPDRHRHRRVRADDRERAGAAAVRARAVAIALAIALVADARASPTTTPPEQVQRCGSSSAATELTATTKLSQAVRQRRLRRARLRLPVDRRDPHVGLPAGQQRAGRVHRARAPAASTTCGTRSTRCSSTDVAGKPKIKVK